MTRLEWDARSYTTGVDRGVLYPTAKPGVPWNGLTAVTESPVSSDTNPVYVDGQKVERSNYSGDYVATIEAFTYPDEFDPHIGVDDRFTGQNRASFGLSYRTDTRIHILYDVIAVPTSRAYAGMSGDVTPLNFSWEIQAGSEYVPGISTTGHFFVETKLALASAVEQLEDILYGTETEQPRLPSMEEIVEIFESNAVLRITNHGDGTWTAEGPGVIFEFYDDGTFQIDWPSAVFITGDTFKIQSL